MKKDGSNYGTIDKIIWTVCGLVNLHDSVIPLEYFSQQQIIYNLTKLEKLFLWEILYKLKFWEVMIHYIYFDPIWPNKEIKSNSHHIWSLKFWVMIHYIYFDPIWPNKEIKSNSHHTWQTIYMCKLILFALTFWSKSTLICVS